jgi:hypothetical protein
MPIASQFAPQIEQFIHDNPQGVMTSFRRNGMPQLSMMIGQYIGFGRLVAALDLERPACTL